MSVNEKMAAIADAIREKTGGTDALTLDGMAAAIAGISAGGGSISTGTVTLAKNFTSHSASTNFNSSSNLLIEHGLGVDPSGMLWVLIDGVENATSGYAHVERLVTRDCVQTIYGTSSSATTNMTYAEVTDDGWMSAAFSGTFRHDGYALLNASLSGVMTGSLPTGATIIWFVW